MMKQTVPDEDLIKRYLLGELSEDARQQIEERLVSADDDFYEKYLSVEDRVEDELIDRYVGGEMSERERERFDRIFLSTPRRFEKLRLNESLHDYVNTPKPNPQTHSPPLPAATPTDRPGVDEAGPLLANAALAHSRGWFAPIAFALMLVAAVCAGLLYLKAGRLEKELAELQAQPQPQPTPDESLQRELSNLRAREDELTQALRRAQEQLAVAEQRQSSSETRVREDVQAKTRPSPAKVLTLALGLINIRGEGSAPTNTLRLTPDTTGVRLILGLDTIDPADYRDFRAEVSVKGGAVVWSRAALRATGRGEPRVTLTILASRLSGGDYVARLSGRTKDGGLSLIGVYDFHVTRE